jgi:peptidoglycan/xylan/chitin deacetylase (PgdA/CDA1 family)
MDWGQLAEMAHAGMEIGSHGLSHSSLGKWPDGRAREEIVKSKEVIEQRLNIPCRHFAFPFGARGDYNSRLITLARQAGYDACFLNIQGYNYFRGDPFYLKRIAVEEISNIRHILF